MGNRTVLKASAEERADQLGKAVSEFIRQELAVTFEKIAAVLVDGLAPETTERENSRYTNETSDRERVKLGKARHKARLEAARKRQVRAKK